MSNKLNVIDAWHEAYYADPPSSALKANKTFLSDDFKNLDVDGNLVMDKAAYTGLGMLLLNAFPDYKVVFHEKREEGDGVMMRFHFEGTQTGDLDLSAMGLGVIPASGKKVVWPEASAMWKVEGGKIVSIQSLSGSMADFLEPLGVKIPSQ